MSPCSSVAEQFHLVLTVGARMFAAIGVLEALIGDDRPSRCLPFSYIHSRAVSLEARSGRRVGLGHVDA